MIEKHEMEIRGIMKSLQNRDIALAHLSRVNSLAFFVRDDACNLEAFRGILVDETEGGILTRIEFADGTFSNELFISGARQDWKMFCMLCKQRVLTIVYVSQNGEIQRVIGSLNPLHGKVIHP